MSVEQWGSYFVYDDIVTNECGVWISGVGTYDTPTRDVEYISIAGRNGVLSFDNDRFDSVTIVYPCFVPVDFETKFPMFRTRLLSKRGFNRLTDSYSPDHYRLAQVTGQITPETGAYNKSGAFEVQFLCQPQRFLKSGEDYTNMVSNDTITNPTLYPARPMLRIAMAGGSSGTLTFGGQTITITDSPTSYVYIDCERQDAYFQQTNLNPYVTLTTGDFPLLESGNNTLTFTGGITRVAVAPRWWEI